MNVATEAIKQALGAVEDRGRALRTLVECAEIGRRHRSVDVPIRWIREDDRGIRGLVDGRRGTYAVAIPIVGGIVRSPMCDCPDHGRAGPCKHVLAVAGDWIENVGRPVWRALRTALSAAEKKTA